MKIFVTVKVSQKHLQKKNKVTEENSVFDLADIITGQNC